MTYRVFRRRMGEALAAHDWLEGLSTFVGVVFLALAGLCAWGIATSIASWGDVDRDFETTVGFLQVTRGFGVVLFGVLGLVATGVGWFLARDGIRRRLRRRARGG